MNKKLYLILSIVAILIIIGGIWYWQSRSMSVDQSVDQTANWKTYVNNEYGFEFKYPQDWGDLKVSDGSGYKKDPWVYNFYEFTSEWSSSTQKAPADFPGLEFTIVVWNQAHPDLDSAIGSSPDSKTEKEDTQIGGIKGVKITGVGANPEKLPTSTFIVRNKNYAYVIEPGSWQVPSEILSTFKFTK